MAVPSAITAAAARNTGTRPHHWASSPHSNAPIACPPANTMLYIDSPRARTQPGRNTCSAPVTVISTHSQAIPAGTSRIARATRLRTSTQASSDAVKAAPATSSSRLGESRPPNRGSRSAPSTAPAPNAASSTPYPVGPAPSSRLATSGSSAHSAAPGSTNSPTRSSIRRTAGELRT